MASRFWSARFSSFCANRAASAILGPPSVLPDISPSRGKIGCYLRFRQFPALNNVEEAIRREAAISPLAGRAIAYGFLRRRTP
ncbi:hypothetical protein EN750_21600, partial [Mesorhizobium sp. M7A.F.Ca.ET.027.03.2.1]